MTASYMQGETVWGGDVMYAKEIDKLSKTSGPASERLQSIAAIAEPSQNEPALGGFRWLVQHC